MFSSTSLVVPCGALMLARSFAGWLVAVLQAININNSRQEVKRYAILVILKFLNTRINKVQISINTLQVAIGQLP